MRTNSIAAATFSLLASMQLVGCVTTSHTPAPAPPPGGTSVGTPKDGPSDSGAEKAGSKTDSEVSAQEQSLPPPSQDAMLGFIRNHRAPNAPFGPKEHEFVSSLPSSPEPGSIAEAALVLGLTKSVLHPLTGNAATFQESDLGIAEPDSNRTVPSRAVTLEQLCVERDVSLVDALNENLLLLNAGVVTQVIVALDLPGTSDDLRNEAFVSLRQQAALWHEIAQKLGASPDAGNAAPAASISSANPSDMPPPNPGDLRSGDSTLAEAQSLADRGDYQAAIKKAVEVDASHPMHPLAQEKIREFSNLAVQDLRRKAAHAFQSAMPINDKRTRAAYLQQAKGYLEEALNSYPEATQLPTVRDNLRVISRDLEKLQAEQAE